MKAMTNLLQVAAFAAILSSCSTPGGDLCDIAKPGRFSEETINAMTDEEVAREVTRNETLERLCGFKP